jgi:probable phosphoglycerate mutase
MSAMNAPPGVTRLVLVRHGQARGFVEHIVAGHDSCTGLTDLGRQQAEALRARLERTGELTGATALYASAMLRAQETASIVRPAVGHGSLDVIVECDVCELHPGSADGMSWQEYSSRWPISVLDGTDRAVAGPDGSESVEEFVARVGGGLQRIADQHAGGTVVIACHGGVVSCSLETLGGIPFGSFHRNVENTSITEWERDDASGRWWLVRLNDAAHVDGSAPRTA